MYTRTLLAGAASILVFLTGGPLAFGGTVLTYDVSEDGSYVGGDALTDPGLTISYALVDGLDDTVFTLDDGESETFDFFEIWTDEKWLNCDDLDDQSIEANLAFDLPPGATANVQGSTDGKIYVKGFLVIAYGKLEWDGPVTVVADDRVFTVSLSDEYFNAGYFGLNPGQKYGATVQATITQTAAAPLPPAVVMGMALLGGLFAARRRRRETRAAA
jgi:MYXO-CTERM domain-containing protein